MTSSDSLVVQAQMLIRQPAAAVYEAFVDPVVTTRFWFTGSSGPLKPDAALTWEWEMYGITVPVTVRALEPPSRILIEWGTPPSPVEWKFTPYGHDQTLARIKSWGFRGSDAEQVAQALDAMGGFTNVLAALKALLEHDVELNLVSDHHPPADPADPPPDA